jgi:hypothetical protein
MSKHYYGEDDLDFLSPPSLSEAAVGNPFKTLLILAGVYTAGAIIGRQRSVQGATFAGRKLGEGVSWTAKKIGDAASKVQKKPSANIKSNPPYVITSHQLEMK